MEKKAWPYMAGLMDSEGSIGLSISRKKNGVESFNVSIQLSNTSRLVIDWIVRNFGGTFCTEIKKNSFMPGSKVFRWSLYGKENQEQFLLGVIPYLVIKKENARLVLDYMRLNRGESLKRREFWSQLKEYNAHDVPVPERIKRGDNSKTSAYIAGYIDGDGCLCGTYTRGLNISINTTDFIAVKWFMANFGGRFHCRDRQRLDIAKSKIQYQWFLSGVKNKERFLLDVIPHLVLKKKRAKCLLECVRLRQQDPFGRNEEISNRIKQLNSEIRNFNSDSAIDSATTDTSNVSENLGIKTQSELTGNSKSALVMTQEAINN